MPMDVSQLYMLALRPTTRLPIIGESTDDLFRQQVELLSWSWDFHNEEERVRNEARKEKLGRYKSKLETMRKASLAQDMKRQLKGMEKDKELAKLKDDIKQTKKRLDRLGDSGSDVKTKEELFKGDIKRMELRVENFDGEKEKEIRRLQKSMDRAARGEAEDSEEEDEEMERLKKEIERAERDPNFEFSFTKRVDFASTQLLNCMKAGDLLPTVTLTMHQASSNTPWSLVITVSNMRLLKYALRVEASDTMSEMTEDWTCEFESFGYVYQNRPHAGVKSMTAGNVNTQVARAATQATVRTFMMKNMKFF